MRKLFLSLACAIALTACMNAQQTTFQSVAYTCTAADYALQGIIAVNSRLTPAQRAAVDRAVAVIDPVCSQPMVPTLTTTAQAALTGALSQLTAVKAATP